MRHLRARLGADREIACQLAVAFEDQSNQFGSWITDAAIYEMGPFTGGHNVIRPGLQRHGVGKPAAPVGKDPLDKSMCFEHVRLSVAIRRCSDPSKTTILLR